jgi:hypothetical protein
VVVVVVQVSVEVLLLVVLAGVVGACGASGTLRA